MWKLLSEELPPIGAKFIALWGDGSGAGMYFRHDAGFIDSDGDEYAALNDDLYEWAYLPKGFQFWCEGTDEPVNLPAWGGPLT